MPGPISDSYQGPDGGRDPYFEGMNAFKTGGGLDTCPEDGSDMRELWEEGWRDAKAQAAMPSAPGYYWAIMRKVDREPEGEDWISGRPEVVEVVENYGDDDEYFMVAVPGMQPSQNLKNFDWLSGKLEPPALSK